MTYRAFSRSTVTLALASALSASAYAQVVLPTAASAPTHAGTSANRAPASESRRDRERARVELNRAQRALSRENYRVAASSLRRAAAAIDHEAARAEGDSNLRLVRDAAGLRAAAAELDARRIDPGALGPQLAQARADLARYYYAAAAEAWAKNEYAQATHALGTAARYVENGLTSVGESSTELASAQASTARLAEKGERAVVADYERARAAVGRGLDRLRTVIESNETSSNTASPPGL